jgi:hypothetical protein
VQGSGNEAAYKFGLLLNRAVGGDEAVAVEIESGVGVGELDEFLRRGLFAQQRLANRKLPDRVNPTEREERRQ